MKLLTLAIPTYKRHSELSHLLRKLAAINFSFQLDVLVVDDSGYEGNLMNHLFKECELSNDKRFRYIINRTNIGYAKTLCMIYQNCDSKYVLLLEDDGDINIDILMKLYDFLKENNFQIGITPFTTLGGNKIRIMKNIEKNGTEILYFMESISHAPGIIYDTVAMKRVLNEISRLGLNNYGSFLIYPQVFFYLVGLISVPEFKIKFIEMEIALANKILEQPSSLKDKNGMSYWDPRSRIFQAFDFYFLSKELAEEFPNQISDKLLTHLRRELFYKVVKRSVQYDFLIKNDVAAFALKFGIKNFRNALMGIMKRVLT